MILFLRRRQSRDDFFEEKCLDISVRWRREPLVTVFCMGCPEIGEGLVWRDFRRLVCKTSGAFVQVDGFEAFDDMGPAVRACDLESFVLLLWFLLAGHGLTE